MPETPRQMLQKSVQINREKADAVVLAHANKESFLKRVLPWFSLISVLIAALTFVTNANLRRKELTFSFTGVDNLVHIDRSSLKGSLSIRYQDYPISELYRLTFVLRNTGSSAIRAEDVKEPLQIIFPAGYVLLEPTIVEQQTKPQFSIQVVRDLKLPQVLDVSFPLLNPGDEVHLSINTLQVGAGSPILSGRIVDVRQITNLDLSKSKMDQRSPMPFVQNAKLRQTFYWLIVLFNGLLGVVFVILLFFTIIAFARRKFWLQKWGDVESKMVAERKAFRDKELVTTTNLGEFRTRTTAFEEEQEATRLSLGIPSKPGSLADEWQDLTAASATFLVIAFCLLMTCIYIVTGPGV